MHSLGIEQHSKQASLRNTSYARDCALMGGVNATLSWDVRPAAYPAVRPVMLIRSRLSFLSAV